MRLTPAFERHTPVIDLVTHTSKVTNPDPDTFYSPSQVPNYVEDPVGEVLLHSGEVIRRRIKRREFAAVEKTEIPIARAANAVLTHEIPRDGRPKSNPTLSTKSTATNTEPSVPVTASRDYRSLIARQQSTMRNNINSDPRNAFLDVSVCHYHSCPYSVGGLMAQRFALMQRLRQINMVLYGDEEYYGE